MAVGAIRAPAVAGRFYPREPAALADVVDRLLAEAASYSRGRPWGVVVPHAGYRYSGPVAASAYARVRASSDAIARVVVLGPAHFVPLLGCAVPSTSAWRTPLGDVAVDADLREEAIRSGCAVDDEPHAPEHALEVQLPFLQRLLGQPFEVLPVAVGRIPAAAAASLFESLAPRADLVVVSTDLSHDEDLETARRLDRRTADAVVRLDTDGIGSSDACGAHALRGVVAFARRADMSIRTLDLRTSGDTTGDPRRVVGYGAFAIGI